MIHFSFKGGFFHHLISGMQIESISKYLKHSHSILLAVCVTIIPSTPQAQIIIPSDYIRNQIEHGIDCYIGSTTKDCPVVTKNASCQKLFWPYENKHVIVLRYDDTSLESQIFLKCVRSGSPNPLVTMNVRLKFSCNWRNPAIAVGATRIKVDVDVPGWADLLIYPWYRAVRSGQEASAKAMTDGTAKSFFRKIELQSSMYCPGILVQEDGSLRLDFGPGTECQGAVRRHTNCNTHTTQGPGRDFRCINGRWEPEKGYCEPKAPSGGQAP